MRPYSRGPGVVVSRRCGGGDGIFFDVAAGFERWKGGRDWLAG